MNHDATFLLNNPGPGDFEKAIKWLRLVANQVKTFTYEENHGCMRPGERKRHEKALAAARRRRMEKKRLAVLKWRGKDAARDQYLVCFQND